VTLRRISSRANPWYRGVLKLAGSAPDRRKTGRTLLDGVHLVEAWIERHGPPDDVVVSDSGLTHPEVARLAAKCHATVLPDELFAALTDLVSPTGVLAVITVPPPDDSKGPPECIALLEAIQDPGNMGSIVRSAAAAGVGAVYLSTGCADPWAPRTLRAAMGGHFRVQLYGHADLLQVARSFSGRVLAAGAREPTSVFETDLRGPSAFVFGSEGAGLSAPLLAAAHAGIAIPMAGGTESLNVAAAAAVCFFERVRQLRGSGDER
jgi:RNA methyltransferase, TrmH family